jgi:RhoGAP domain
MNRLKSRKKPLDFNKKKKTVGFEMIKTPTKLASQRGQVQKSDEEEQVSTKKAESGLARRSKRRRKRMVKERKHLSTPPPSAVPLLSKRHLAMRRLTKFTSLNNLHMLSPRQPAQSRPRKRQQRPDDKENSASTTNNDFVVDDEDEVALDKLYEEEHGMLPPGLFSEADAKRARRSIRMTGQFSRTLTGTISRAGGALSLRVTEGARRKYTDVRSLFASPMKGDDAVDDEASSSAGAAAAAAAAAVAAQVKAARKVFGRSIIELMQEQLAAHPCCPVPLIVRDAVAYLSEHGVKTQGLFRVSASSIHVDALQARYDAGESVQLDGIADVHIVSCLLKKYLRELPEPIVPYALEEAAKQAVGNDDVDDADIAQLERIKRDIVDSPLMSPTHFHVLKAVVGLASLIAAHSEHTLMDANNLSLVFGPNLQPSAAEQSATQQADLLALFASGGNPHMHINKLVRIMIVNCTFFFSN